MIFLFFFFSVIQQKLQSRYKNKSFLGLEVLSIKRIAFYRINFPSLAYDIKLKNMFMFSRPEADYRKAQAFSGNANERNVSIRSKSVPAKNFHLHIQKERRKGREVCF